MRSAWYEAAGIVLRLTVVSPPVFSGADASASPVLASSTRTVAVPLPPPPGENSDVLTTSDPHAVTIRPGAAPIGIDTALPEAAKLTGACVTCTRSRLGEVLGAESRACQRTPCTVKRKLRISLGELTVTGKYSDQNSLPFDEYGWRKLIQSATFPVDARSS